MLGAHVLHHIFASPELFGTVWAQARDLLVSIPHCGNLGPRLLLDIVRLSWPRLLLDLLGTGAVQLVVVEHARGLERRFVLLGHCRSGKRCGKVEKFPKISKNSKKCKKRRGV